MEENENIFLIKNFECISKNSASKICSERNCPAYAFICPKPDCRCAVLHANCHKNIEINEMFDKIKQKKIQLK